MCCDHAPTLRDRAISRAVSKSPAPFPPLLGNVFVLLPDAASRPAVGLLSRAMPAVRMTPFLTTYCHYTAFVHVELSTTRLHSTSQLYWHTQRTAQVCQQAEALHMLVARHAAQNSTKQCMPLTALPVVVTVAPRNKVKLHECPMVCGTFCLCLNCAAALQGKPALQPGCSAQTENSIREHRHQPRSKRLITNLQLMSLGGFGPPRPTGGSPGLPVPPDWRWTGSLPFPTAVPAAPVHTNTCPLI